jgi:hypothetical protein
MNIINKLCVRSCIVLVFLTSQSKDDVVPVQDCHFYMTGYKMNKIPEIAEHGVWETEFISTTSRHDVMHSKHITKSKPKFFLMFTLGSITLLLLMLFLAKIREMILKTNVILKDWSFLVIILAFSVYLLYILLYGTQVITVETDKIVYKNWLTRETKIYLFKDLDGFITRREGAHSGDYEILFLVKGGKKSGKISSLYYSNYPELVAGLKNLKFLGH